MGSCPRARRGACAKDGVSLPILSWETSECRSPWTHSIESSMEVIFSDRWLLIGSGSAAGVVDWPLPVVPVISVSPRLASHARLLRTRP